jgi:cytochrome c551/c552/glucose/arabinose dehydrogenase
MKTLLNRIFTFAILFLSVFSQHKAYAQESAKEEDYFKILRIPTPQGIVLEVGGLAVLPNGDLGVTTRRGDIFIVENPTSQNPFFRKYASGLHEVLGLAYKNGALYCAQRGELTKLVDSNMDGKADIFETVYSWPISGNYHEYSFGPVIAADGSFFVSANVGFPDEWWRPKSFVPWRGWMMNITDEGKMEPWATGMRSPCGLGIIDGELFYADNQGDWVASGNIMHVKKGIFAGNPAGLRWTDMPNSPLKLKEEDIYSLVDPRIEKDEDGRPIKPENRINENYTTLFEMKKHIPQLQLPAVWLPHGVLGISLSEITKIPASTFGPFAGQMLIGDQGQSKIMRVFMEKVKGEFQGAVWDFRSGFQSGVLRMAWAKDGSLFVGETNRGWGSAGEANEGLQRLVWNGKIPFEMQKVRVMPDGFEIEFTKPVNKKSAEDLASYAVESFIYKYHPVYGSPPVNSKKCAVKGVKVSEDGRIVRIVVDSLRQYYIHNITLDGIRDVEHSYSLVHPTVYYTLNNFPEGEKLSLSQTSTYNSATIREKQIASAKPVVVKNTVAKVLTTEEIKPLLLKHTCSACHSVDKRQVGPAFTEIAKRKYSSNKIVELIYNPQPSNWPDYSTPMAPMPQVPKGDALKIAEWINSLKK